MSSPIFCTLNPPSFSLLTLQPRRRSGLWKVDSDYQTHNNGRGDINKEEEQHDDIGLARSVMIFAGTCRNCQVNSTLFKLVIVIKVKGMYDLILMCLGLG